MGCVVLNAGGRLGRGMTCSALEKRSTMTIISVLPCDGGSHWWNRWQYVTNVIVVLVEEGVCLQTKCKVLWMSRSMQGHQYFLCRNYWVFGWEGFTPHDQIVSEGRWQKLLPYWALWWNYCCWRIIDVPINGPSKSAHEVRLEQNALLCTSIVNGLEGSRCLNISTVVKALLSCENAWSAVGFCS